MNLQHDSTFRSALEAALTRRLPATLDFLEDLVGINSFTRNADGINQNAQRIIRQFAPLGFTSSLIPCAVPDTGMHLVLDSGGDKAGHATVACISHLDTVYPPEEEQRNAFAWKVEGERIYGPGTVDIKGGTALLWMVLDALAEVAPEQFHATRWILLWNAAEEVLARDFGELCLRVLPPETRACLIFEGGLKKDSQFNLICSRKGSGKFRIRVEGRGAHSGVAYEQGANAIHQLARVIDRVMALSDLARGTTVNVGVVRGGTVTNRVPHEAEAILEVRAFDREHFIQVRDTILSMGGPGDVTAAEDGFACTISIEQEKETPPWPQNEATQSLFETWQRAAAQCGYSVVAASRGGLSDGNWLWNHFPTLDALGPSGGNLHASERSDDGTKLPEFVEPASMVPKALLDCLALLELTT